MSWSGKNEGSWAKAGEEWQTSSWANGGGWYEDRSRGHGAPWADGAGWDQDRSRGKVATWSGASWKCDRSRGHDSARSDWLDSSPSHDPAKWEVPRVDDARSVSDLSEPAFHTQYQAHAQSPRQTAAAAVAETPPPQFQLEDQCQQPPPQPQQLPPQTARERAAAAAEDRTDRRTQLMGRGRTSCRAAVERDVDDQVPVAAAKEKASQRHVPPGTGRDPPTKAQPPTPIVAAAVAGSSATDPRLSPRMRPFTEEETLRIVNVEALVLNGNCPRSAQLQPMQSAAEPKQPPPHHPCPPLAPPPERAAATPSSQDPSQQLPPPPKRQTPRWEVEAPCSQGTWKTTPPQQAKPPSPQPKQPPPQATQAPPHHATVAAVADTLAGQVGNRIDNRGGIGCGPHHVHKIAANSTCHNKKFFDDAAAQHRSESMAGRYHRKDHNCAAKYLRWMAMKQSRHSIDLPASEITVNGINHAELGPKFEIDEGITKKWCWLDMIAMLDPQSRNKVFGNSDGLVSCSFNIREQLSQRRAPTGLPMWDFIVQRNDGSVFRLHPEYSKTAVPCSEVELVPSPVNTDGAFKNYRNSLGTSKDVCRFGV